jgi:hypothetical protein
VLVQTALCNSSGSWQEGREERKEQRARAGELSVSNKVCHRSVDFWRQKWRVVSDSTERMSVSLGPLELGNHFSNQGYQNTEAQGCDAINCCSNSGVKPTVDHPLAPYDTSSVSPLPLITCIIASKAFKRERLAAELCEP